MFESYRIAVEKRLDAVLSPYNSEYSVLIDAMRYSASAGGKRIRPSLMMEFTCICGENPEKALGFAAALEMIHTYSLIHDDLPCMDDDSMRRGKPSSHIAFGEATALLAGDALLTEAFRVSAGSDIEPYRAIKAIGVLASCAGVHGMIGGQVIDLKYENTTAPLNAITEMYRLKTGALLVAAAKIGCIIGGADEETIAAAGRFADGIGLAFQIKDDILDITSTSEVLGKPTGSDDVSDKSTYVSSVGLQKAQEDVIGITEKAVKELDVFGSAADNLRAFVRELCLRIK